MIWVFTLMRCEISAAIVCGNDAGNYRSGMISDGMFPQTDEVYIELERRLQALGML